MTVVGEVKEKSDDEAAVPPVRATSTLVLTEVVVTVGLIEMVGRFPPVFSWSELVAVLKKTSPQFWPESRNTQLSELIMLALASAPLQYSRVFASKSTPLWST